MKPAFSAIPEREPVVVPPRPRITLALEVAILRKRVFCVDCGAGPLKRSQYEYDHELARELGGTDDAENLDPRCLPCHDIKTAKDQALIAKGRRLRGETCTKPRGRPIRSRGFQPPYRPFPKRRRA